MLWVVKITMYCAMQVASARDVQQLWKLYANSFTKRQWERWQCQTSLACQTHPRGRRWCQLPIPAISNSGKWGRWLQLRTKKKKQCPSRRIGCLFPAAHSLAQKWFRPDGWQPLWIWPHIQPCFLAQMIGLLNPIDSNLRFPSHSHVARMVPWFWAGPMPVKHIVLPWVPSPVTNTPGHRNASPRDHARLESALLKPKEVRLHHMWQGPLSLSLSLSVCLCRYYTLNFSGIVAAQHWITI